MKHLIDRLQIAQGNNNVEELIPEAIEMLRQLQARNKLLTDVLIETNTFARELRAENEALKAGGEPVAWTVYSHNENDIAWTKEGLKLKAGVPLYTHPAKTLTYEEMLKTVMSYFPSGVESACAQQLGWSHEYMLGYNDALRETRIRLAILRKANEK